MIRERRRSRLCKLPAVLLLVALPYLPHPAAADGAFLDEGAGLVDEDLTDVLGIVDEDDGGAEER